MAILAFLSAILILILVHELGHFFAAKLVNIKVERFSIGFGKPFLKYKSKNKTEYVLAPILLGGFVKLDESSFKSSSSWKRLFILIAGVLANILVSIIIFWFLFTIGIDYLKPVIGKITLNSIAYDSGLKVGEEIKTVDDNAVKNWQAVNISVIYRIGDNDIMRINGHNLNLRDWQLSELNPDPLMSLGIEPYEIHIPVTIGKVSKHSYAAAIGLEVNDRILAINDHAVNTWKDFISYIRERPGQKAYFTIERGNKERHISGNIGSKLGINLRFQGYLGIAPIKMDYPSSMVVKEKYPFYQAIFPALKEVYDLLALNFIVLVKLLTGKMSLHVLGGPITIFNSATMAFSAGLLAYVSFLALFSVMLAFVNILPIPVLDGGSCLLLLIEIVLGKPIPEKIQQVLIKAGALVLTLLVFLSIGNDLLRLFL